MVRAERPIRWTRIIAPGRPIARQSKFGNESCPASGRADPVMSRRTHTPGLARVQSLGPFRGNLPPPVSPEDQRAPHRIDHSLSPSTKHPKAPTPSKDQQAGRIVPPSAAWPPQGQKSLIIIQRLPCRGNNDQLKTQLNSAVVPCAAQCTNE